MEADVRLFIDNGNVDVCQQFLKSKIDDDLWLLWGNLN
jgi:hypothetical protein